MVNSKSYPDAHANQPKDDFLRIRQKIISKQIILNYDKKLLVFELKISSERRFASTDSLFSLE